MATAILEIDHLAYISNRKYRRTMHAQLRRLKGPGLVLLEIWHEADSSCCEREPWQECVLAVAATAG